MLEKEQDCEYREEDFMKSPPLSEHEDTGKTAEKNQDKMFDNLDDFFDQ